MVNDELEQQEVEVDELVFSERVHEAWVVEMEEEEGA